MRIESYSTAIINITQGVWPMTKNLLNIVQNHDLDNICQNQEHWRLFLLFSFFQ